MVNLSGGWKNVRLVNAYNPEYARFHGRDFAAIGEALEMDPADAAWSIMVQALPERAMALYFMMSEEDVRTILREPWVSIGSDAGSAAKLGEIDDIGLPHPRAYGTFPRIIAEYVRETGVLTLEDAIRKMSSWPASRMKLQDRGLIKEGLWADVVVFDYARIQDHATWGRAPSDPERHSLRARQRGDRRGRRSAYRRDAWQSAVRPGTNLSLERLNLPSRHLLTATRSPHRDSTLVMR